MTLGEYVQIETTRLAHSALDAIERGEIRNSAQLGEYVHEGLGQLTAALTSILGGAATSAIATPAMQAAAQAFEPVLEQALSDYLPTFAAVTGGLLAVSVLLGVWVAKETFHRGGRRS